jgi:AraC-like DNA-binding protein
MFRPINIECIIMNVMSPGARTGLKDSAILIDQQYLSSSPDELGGWSEKSLPATGGQAKFLTAHICKDIMMTCSECIFTSAFLSTIHYHRNTTLLIFGIKGYSTFSFESDGHTCTIRPGDVWLINISNDSLCRITEADQYNEMAVLRYSTHRITQAFGSETDESQFINNSILRLGRQESIDYWLQDLLKNPLASASDRLLAEAQALVLMSRWIGPAIPSLNRYIEGVSQNEKDKMRTVIELLIKDLGDTPSLQKISSCVGMSHTRLNRIFRKVHGETVFNWLREYRLERAKGYLKDEARSITAISFQCGFSSASHFSQSFRKQYQCSPIEYRQCQKHN